MYSLLSSKIFSIWNLTTVQVPSLITWILIFALFETSTFHTVHDRDLNLASGEMDSLLVISNLCFYYNSNSLLDIPGSGNDRQFSVYSADVRWSFVTPRWLSSSFHCGNVNRDELLGEGHYRDYRSTDFNSFSDILSKFNYDILFSSQLLDIW